MNDKLRRYKRRDILEKNKNKDLRAEREREREPTSGIGEDGESKSPDVEEAKPNRGQAK